MPRYDVGVVMRVWITKETNAKTREEAEERIFRQAKNLCQESGFCWNSGEVGIVSCHNLSLLNKIPFQ